VSTSRVHSEPLARAGPANLPRNSPQQHGQGSLGAHLRGPRHLSARSQRHPQDHDRRNPRSPAAGRRGQHQPRAGLQRDRELCRSTDQLFNRQGLFGAKPNAGVSPSQFPTGKGLVDEIAEDPAISFDQAQPDNHEIVWHSNDIIELFFRERSWWKGKIAQTFDQAFVCSLWCVVRFRFLLCFLVRFLVL
jgi:hypothetical protein